MLRLHNRVAEIVLKELYKKQMSFALRGSGSGFMLLILSYKPHNLSSYLNVCGIILVFPQDV